MVPARPGIASSARGPGARSGLVEVRADVDALDPEILPRHDLLDLLDGKQLSHSLAGELDIPGRDYQIVVLPNALEPTIPPPKCSHSWVAEAGDLPAQSPASSKTRPCLRDPKRGPVTSPNAASEVRSRRSLSRLNVLVSSALGSAQSATQEEAPEPRALPA